MHKKNFLLQKLRNDEPVLGTWCIIPSVETIDIIASSGLDFLIIDREHGPICFETAQKMIMACESRSVSPVIRLGGVSEDEILKALDIGAHCIQIPNISSIEQVEELISFAKYPPVGKRGFSPFTRAGNYSNKWAKEHTKISNENTLISINIEGTEAINNIDNILKYDEIDIVFVGLFDLSKSLGIPGETENPKVIRQLELLTNKINESGKYTGTITQNINDVRNFYALGVKYIVHLVDCDMLRKSYSEIKNAFDSL